MFQNNPKEKKAAEAHVDNAVSDIKSAKGELKNAKDEAVKGAKRELERFSDTAEDKVRGLRESAREAGEKVQHFLHDRKDDVAHAKDTAERTIRSNPLASAAIAFATGALLSRLLKR